MNRSQIEASDSVVPREAVATPEDVKRFLELTPEAIEELRKEQALTLFRSRARLSGNEWRRGRGIELEQHYRITGDRDGLAEALKLQGKYAAAAEAAKTESLKVELQEMADAVECDDAGCSCDNFVEQGEYNLPTKYVAFYGHSDPHEGEVAFVRCTLCGLLNAGPTPRHLMEQREMRHSQRPDPEKLKFFKK